MKALILSGGKGTRLRPITHTSAKQLVPIANKPILFYALEAMAEAKIQEVGIVVGDTKQEIRGAVGDGAQWGLDVTYIEQEAPLGLAHAVKIAGPFLGNDPFVMYLGDNLVKDGIRSLVEEFERLGANSQILLARVRDPQRFGVAELQDGRVISLEEKPTHPKSDLALVGVYMFDHTIFGAVNAIQPSHRGELEITDAIQYLIDHGYRVHPHVISGWWKDTGKLEDMLEANRIMLEAITPRVDGDVDGASHVIGKVVIEEGASVTASTIRGPVVIGKRCRIINSYIGPFTSIYHDTLVCNSEIEHSIILDQCRITDIGGRLEDSLIGKNVEVFRSGEKPKAYRLMLGDSSQVGLV
ncbi:glucose-1-phosphate thymidylyltransferase [Candidatus Methylomirabilis lanthanidiphila]|uniref:Glucose-1-phosphate thymidylyltransferase n=1 Tax=Candidatus Methylomirabilis lanthanidiphila TaxID=2211376 RepID=A0A564ZKA7_9BACT|nr:glucose-1-phosphate thymidylyltransferase [Candidatus Methylomirabilis lanthanidiphila]VUZ85769.1 glucose-1-phosphate thymidylyltransferase [Candidatus Methylomirabilis lanthanidiphila]